MKFHFEQVAKFKTYVTTGALNNPDRAKARVEIDKSARPALSWALSFGTFGYPRHRRRPHSVNPATRLEHRAACAPVREMMTVSMHATIQLRYYTAALPYNYTTQVREMMTMSLHAADVSNPCKPWRLSSIWAARVMTEFFRQGDTEVAMGVPISPFMDREKTDIAQCQAGFLKYMIKPFFEDWTGWLGERIGREIDGHIVANLKIWEEQGEAALGNAVVHAVKSRPSADITAGTTTESSSTDTSEKTRGAKDDSARMNPFTRAKTFVSIKQSR